MSTGTGPSYLFIEQLVEEGNLPHTPKEASPACDERISFVSEAALLGVAKVLGEPLGYVAEKRGALVQHVFPVEQERDSPSNESSASMLNLHTELVFSRRTPTRHLDIDSPDFILLWCLRSDREQAAATLVATVADLCAQLQPSDLKILSEPRFEQRAPYSFTRDRAGDRPWIGPVPILRGEGSQRLAAFDLACGTRGVDEAAERALNALRDAANVNGITKKIYLRPGDLLVLNNRRCAHGRTPFAAQYDGADRWLLRVYVRRSLAGMQPVDQNAPRVF